MKTPQIHTTRCILQLERPLAVAQVTISYPKRFNAMSRAMWRQLRESFEQLQNDAQLRAVLIAGEGAHFCSGGDISEYASFRFEESSLRDFHENEVWPALQAMLDCDLPIVAQIQGNCMGAGVEIASCCDIRLSSSTASFGAPIARLGFPMAPREAELVARETGLGVARQMLLEAALFSADEMKAAGFLSQVVAADALADVAQKTLRQIAELAPLAARLNKRTLRSLRRMPASPVSTACVIDEGAPSTYAYANSAEHREGIGAFLAKRKPVF